MPIIEIAFECGFHSDRFIIYNAVNVYISRVVHQRVTFQFFVILLHVIETHHMCFIYTVHAQNLVFS